jgi:hypothetical protein
LSDAQRGAVTRSLREPSPRHNCHNSTSSLARLGLSFGDHDIGVVPTTPMS